MKRALFIALGAMIALQPVQVSAQIVFNGTPNDVEWLNFIEGSHQGGTYHVQVGPYSGQFLADDAVARTVTTSPFSLYCVDYYHYASYSNGLVNVTGLGDGGSFDVGNNTRLGDYGRYQQSAYLASLFDSWAVHGVALGVGFSQAEVWGGLHAAIWSIATGPTDLADLGPDTHFGHFNPNTADARAYFLDLATDNGGSFSTDGWYVVTRTTVNQGNQSNYDGTGQEFLMRVASVPEPGTFLLMVTGLFLLVGVHRKRLIEGFDEA